MATISKGLKGAIVCVLVLGLILEQVHNVEAKSCCKTTTQRNCYNLCRLGSRPRQLCASTCGCKIVSGRTCPRDYHLKFNDLAESGEPDAIQYCNVGCVSSACDDSDTMTDDDGMKIDMERCSDECDRFCKGSARMASVAE